MYRHRPSSVRPPPQILAEASQPTTALMEFVAQALEAAGFDIATDDWPDVAVLVAGHRYMLSSGHSINSRRLRAAKRELQRALEILDG